MARNLIPPKHKRGSCGRTRILEIKEVGALLPYQVYRIEISRSGIDTGKAFSLSGIGGTPCFRLSIQSWVYRSFHRYLYSIPIFLFSFASLSRLSFSAFSLSLSSIPSFLWLALRIDSPKSVDLITVRFESSSIGWIYMLRGDGKVGESWLWTERNKAVVFRWNRFRVSVFFPSLLVSAVRSLFLGYLDHQKG